MENSYTLLQLGLLVRQCVEEGLPGNYWLEAELLSLSAGFHCYMELVEKGPDGNTPVARAKANCWHNLWMRIAPQFEREAGQKLRAGIRLRLLVRPTFHQAYGFAYNVLAIDPTFTVGELALRRQRIVEQLRRDGVFDLNRQLALPMFCQHIAVVSAQTAAGYGDFLHHLEANPHGLQLSTTLFQATMQGEQVESSIIDALNRIAADGSFDCVVIIRGGGAVSDMAGFDTLALAENVAQFPIPVITGIGHDRDECVLDMVSHTRVKTPTAAADAIIDNLFRTLCRIDKAADAIAMVAKATMSRQSLRLARLADKLPAIYAIHKTRQQARLDALWTSIATRARNRIDRSKQTLALHQERLRLQDPKLLLRRGYSITTLGGKAIKSNRTVKPGDTIVTTLYRGKIVSRVYN